MQPKKINELDKLYRLGLIDVSDKFPFLPARMPAAEAQKLADGACLLAEKCLKQAIPSAACRHWARALMFELEADGVRWPKVLELQRNIQRDSSVHVSSVLAGVHKAKYTADPNPHSDG